MSVPSLQLAAALTRLAASQDAQQAESIHLRLTLAEASLADLGVLRTDVARLDAECRRLEEIMGRASSA